MKETTKYLIMLILCVFMLGLFCLLAPIICLNLITTPIISDVADGGLIAQAIITGLFLIFVFSISRMLKSKFQILRVVQTEMEWIKRQEHILKEYEKKWEEQNAAKLLN